MLYSQNVTSSMKCCVSTLPELNKKVSARMFFHIYCQIIKNLRVIKAQFTPAGLMLEEITVDWAGGPVAIWSGAPWWTGWGEESQGWAWVWGRRWLRPSMSFHIWVTMARKLLFCSCRRQSSSEATDSTFVVGPCRLTHSYLNRVVYCMHIHVL